ncbi:hypothetical protein K491DRAFT_781776 [Lophiostoma macrostomum CBS 122681]|uniref:Uncharacterized protein n=1 Tax=Lophiostoma macrostomum CBS 122681 TaxID=1314788 RepID=A0A6A6SVC9_9PLEO|nr:hypothetical protein K491DRAFT_781776 [Lophiostoma macrostomum CBS 122681]
MSMDSPVPRSPLGFEKLPAELYDEIFSYLPIPYTKHENFVVKHVDNDYDMHQFDYLKGVGRGFGFYLLTDTLQLRLVSRAFNRAASRVWFHYESLKLRAYDYKGLFQNSDMRKPGDYEVRVTTPSSIDRISDFLLQSDSLAPLLTHVRIELSHVESGLVKGVSQWMDAQGEPLTNQEEIQSLHKFLALVPPAIKKMERIETLSIYMGQTWESDYSGDSQVDSAPQFNMAALDQLRGVLSSLFSSPPSGLQFLTDLRLTLPCTYDFAALNAAMSDDATARLRHLYIEYCDASGPGGDRSYLMYADDWEGYDGDEYVPLSNLQQEYPNEEYMPDVCRLIGRCHNLESLGLDATHYLALDTLNWRPSGRGLQNIYISRGIVPCKTLRKLLSASDETTSNIFALHLDYVQLLDSTWANVFDHLLASETLKYFAIDDLNYAHRGESAHLRQHNVRQWENSSAIWSEHQEDLYKLQEVIEKVAADGGLLSPGLDYLLDSNDDSHLSQW